MNRGLSFCERVPLLHYTCGDCSGEHYALDMCYTGKDYQVRMMHPYCKADAEKMATFVKEACATEGTSVFFTISCEQFEEFVQYLYEKTMLADWKHLYGRRDVYSGDVVELLVGDQHYRCAYNFPPYFDELQAVMQKWFALAGFSLAASRSADESSSGYGYAVRDDRDGTIPVLIRYRNGEVETFNPEKPGEWFRSPLKDSILFGGGDFIWYDDITEAEVPAIQDIIRKHLASRK